MAKAICDFSGATVTGYPLDRDAPPPIGTIDITLARGVVVTMHPHVGNACPVPAGTPLVIDLGDSYPYLESARDVYWGAGIGDDGEGRVIAYGLLGEAAPKHRRCLVAPRGRRLLPAVPLHVRLPRPLR